ncbi:MAG: response regulator [candidate division NC10 bacterium]|nr:response regulator [candidate division NC10 bacterium]
MANQPILVIDHDPRSREMVTAILGHADFEVLSAPDGPSGIELARKARPVVIIVDMMVPGMDGVGTLQCLKKDPALKDIPVVGVTASMDLTYTQKAFRAGAQFFLPKPFRAASLLCVVELAADSALRNTPMPRRRQHPRHGTDVPVSCFVRGDQHGPWHLMGKATNISLGGFQLLLPGTVAPGTALRLDLGLPEGPITAQGKVIWQESKSMREERSHHGVRLLGFIDDMGTQGYRRYLGQLNDGRTA